MIPDIQDLILKYTFPKQFIPNRFRPIYVYRNQILSIVSGKDHKKFKLLRQKIIML